MKWSNKLVQWRRNRQVLKLRVEEQKVIDADLAERAAIALAFNRRYTVAACYVSTKETVSGEPGAFGIPVNAGHRWMCPTCNMIHAPVRNSVFVGLIYPACCDHPKNTRHDNLGEISIMKRPLGWCGPDGLMVRLKRAGLDVSAKLLEDAPF